MASNVSAPYDIKLLHGIKLLLRHTSIRITCTQHAACSTQHTSGVNGTAAGEARATIGDCSTGAHARTKHTCGMSWRVSAHTRKHTLESAPYLHTAITRRTNTCKTVLFASSCQRLARPHPSFGKARTDQQSGATWCNEGVLHAPKEQIVLTTPAPAATA